MKKRLLFYELIKHLDTKEALVITGMRQVGKTTLIKQIFEELGDTPKLWFDFDNPLDQKTFEDIDYNNIYKRLKNMANSSKITVFLDEIQNFPEITKVIKYLIDHHKVKFIVTGSSNYYMRNLFPESLSGRKFLFNLAPLSFSEYLYLKEQISFSEAGGVMKLEKSIRNSNIFLHKKFEEEYSIYIKYGGFPGVIVAEGNERKKLILKNIFKSFFEKDIKVLADYSDVKELRDLLLLLVPRVGSMLDITKISSELGIVRSKVYRYMEYLEGIFVIKLLPKYSKSIDRAVAGGKKVYFSDTGLLNTIGNVNDGQAFENTLVNQLSPYGELSFYNKRNKSEIDIIVDKKIAFEAKLKGSEHDVRSLKKNCEKLGIKKYFVVSKDITGENKNIISPQVF
ncbi:ATP-binding protein [Candidatus Microgenomates bacterium]|nr:ATP-binding protein [Candidatus Microgenomates bacterium]